MSEGAKHLVVRAAGDDKEHRYSVAADSADAILEELVAAMAEARAVRVELDNDRTRSPFVWLNAGRLVSARLADQKEPRGGSTA
jgi:hypothetical protein